MNIKMRKFFILLIIILIFVPGCWDKREINQLAFVQGLGIDKGKDNMVDLTLQLLKPGLLAGGGGGGAGGGSVVGKPYTVFESSGLDFAKAYMNANAEIPRALFMQHNEIIFFSEKFAKSGVYDTLDFMTRNPEFRRTAYVLVVTKGSLKDLMSISESLERYPYKEILGMINNQRNTSIGYVCDLNEFIDTLETPTKQPIAGRLEIVKKNGKPVGARLVGASIFKNDKLVGFLNEGETEGVMLMMNKMRKGTLTLDRGPKGEKTHISFNITKAHADIIPHIKGDDVSFDVNINAEGNMVEQDVTYDLTEPKMLEKLQQLANEKIKQKINNAISALQKKYKVDTVGFGNIIYQKNPKEWEKLKKDWDEIYPDVKIDVNVKFNIRRTGLSSKPIVPR